MRTGSSVAVGTCDGTGAIINVCLGWVPQKVEIYNMEDAGNLLPRATWIKGFELITAVAQGLLEKIGTTYYAPSGLTAGIYAYAGGTEIHWDSTDSRFENAAAADVSEVYVDGYFKKVSGGASYRCFGDVVDEKHSGSIIKTVPGFSIAADADLNADGEQIIWVAYR